MNIGWAAGKFVVGWAARPAICAVDVQHRRAAVGGTAMTRMTPKMPDKPCYV
jgi:hypothetical protein